MADTSDEASQQPENSTLAAQVAEALVTGALPGELDGFDAANREAAVALALGALAKRSRGRASMLSDTTTAAEAGRVMRLVIVNDDMPFLVDSVAATIAEAGLTIERLLHPVISVMRRNDRPVAIGSGEAESLIYAEIERPDAKTRRALLTALEANLRHVRAAVRDWHALQDAMRGDVSALSESEGRALLEWFLERQFTLLGHTSYGPDGALISALGIGQALGDEVLAPQSRARAAEWLSAHPGPLLVKSNRTSPVHRRAPLDLVIVRSGDGGLSIHAGLWTSSALSTPAENVPILRRRLAMLQEKYEFSATGHAGKALAHALNALPHDLLISVDDPTIEALALTAMSIEDRPRPKLMLAKDALARHLFAFVWLPRDELSSARRVQIAEIIGEAADAPLLSWSIDLGDSGVALLRYTFDIRTSGRQAEAESLDRAITQLVRGWASSVEAALAEQGDARQAARLALRYADALPAPYRNGVEPREAALDITRLSNVGEGGRGVRLYANEGDTANRLRLKLYSLGPLTLSDIVPPLENFGFRVVEELSTAVGEGRLGAITRFVLELPEGQATELLARADVVEAAIAEVLEGRAENDRFNALQITVALPPRAIALYRALFRYLRQTGLSYGLVTVVDALRKQPDLARGIVALFEERHDPDRAARDDTGIEAAIDAALGRVAAIDEDRILRLFRAVVQATVRTNFFAPAASEAIAFKFDSARVPGLPAPVPWREIFVYSPRVEGIHLRAGPVARGGLRWSDRRDDFRTEVLGLMKAQRVKNAVIVPTGAKGGFFPKLLPDPATARDGWLAEGTESYRVFIRTLLSVTDNLVGGQVVHPQRVVVHDGDDPYFVVAADKGTASFSDVANAIALERGFWLGDAFASGGSVGYDHKAMGITAKGAWISVQRHFSEAGVDVQRDPVTMVGCGDMSGDVFGNGLLLSHSVKLVAAFDHRHIFLDPAPDAERSYAERARLFALQRSSWADYDHALISTGGGVFARSLKSVPISAEIRAVLGIVDEALEPAQLIRAILKAPVGLIWFGGIGTYVKAASEASSAVGDTANDALRVNGEEVRAKVIGEGANLGVTQAGRIAYALGGGRINTDFIDNSAGVDCSDHEVNIKIALAADVGRPGFDMQARNALLERMTDEVAHLVLEDNRLQTLALSIAERGGAGAVPSLIRLIGSFVGEGRLDRAVEGLPGDDVLQRRAQEGRGMTRPELAVLLATAKLTLQDAIEAHSLAGDRGMASDLLASFPSEMARDHEGAILTHRLRPQIVATVVANRMVNRLGLVHPFELAEEEGASLGDIAFTFIVAERLFGLGKLWSAIDSAVLSERARLTLFDQIALETRAHMADLLRSAAGMGGVDETVAQLQPGVRALDLKVDELLRDETKAQTQDFARRLGEAGAPEAIVDRVVRLAEMDGAVGLSALSQTSRVDPVALAQAFTRLGAALGLDWAQGTAMQASPTDPWERLLSAGLARDLQQMRLEFLARAPAEPGARVEQWLATHAPRVGQFRQLIDRAKLVAAPSPAMLAQIAGQARVLLSRP